MIAPTPTAECGRTFRNGADLARHEARCLDCAEAIIWCRVADVAALRLRLRDAEAAEQRAREAFAAVAGRPPR